MFENSKLPDQSYFECCSCAVLLLCCFVFLFLCFVLCLSLKKKKHIFHTKKFYLAIQVPHPMPSPLINFHLSSQGIHMRVTCKQTCLWHDTSNLTTATHENLTQQLNGSVHCRRSPLRRDTKPSSPRKRPRIRALEKNAAGLAGKESIEGPPCDLVTLHKLTFCLFVTSFLTIL